MLGADQLEFYTSYTQQPYFGDLGGAILDQYLSFPLFCFVIQCFLNTIGFSLYDANFYVSLSLER
ncbi:hypothetical protein D3C73_1647900 [compost metagenome]